MKWSIAASPMKRSRNNRMLTSIRPTLVLIIALAFVMGSNREMPGAESFLELNFQRFDQNMDGGWRISAKGPSEMRPVRPTRAPAVGGDGGTVEAGVEDGERARCRTPVADFEGL